MSEATSQALVPVQPGQLDKGHTGPAEPYRRTAVTADMAPHLGTSVPATGRLPYRPGEPPRLTKDGKTNPRWAEWHAAMAPVFAREKAANLAERRAEVSQLVAKEQRRIDPKEISALLSDEENGASALLGAVYDRDYAAFERLIGEVINRYGRFYPQEQMSDDEAAALRSGAGLVEDLASQYDLGYTTKLQPWRPHGDDEVSNERSKLAARQGAFMELMSDPDCAQAYNDITALITQAPLKSLWGDPEGAREDVQYAEELAYDLSVAFGKLLTVYLRLFSR